MSLGNTFGSGLGSGNLGLGGGAGPLGNLGGLLGLGNLSAAQGINYRTDALSCTVFVSNVSYTTCIHVYKFKSLKSLFFLSIEKFETRSGPRSAIVK